MRYWVLRYRDTGEPALLVRFDHSNSMSKSATDFGNVMNQAFVATGLLDLSREHSLDVLIEKSEWETIWAFDICPAVHVHTVMNERGVFMTTRIWPDDS